MGKEDVEAALLRLAGGSLELVQLFFSAPGSSVKPSASVSLLLGKAAGAAADTPFAAEDLLPRAAAFIAVRVSRRLDPRTPMRSGTCTGRTGLDRWIGQCRNPPEMLHHPAEAHARGRLNGLGEIRCCFDLCSATHPRINRSWPSCSHTFSCRALVGVLCISDSASARWPITARLGHQLALHMRLNGVPT